MNVIRVQKNKNYTTMANYHLKDKNLSLKAVGLLSKILSLPENWVLSVNGLVSIVKEGRDAVRSCLAELKANGYLKVESLRDKEGHIIGTRYTVMEKPLYFENEKNAEPEKPETENPSLENPTLVNPPLESPRLLSTKEINYEKERENTPHTQPSPTLEQVKAYFQAQHLNGNADDFFRYFEAGGWVSQSGQPIRWKQKAQSWSANERKRPPADPPMPNDTEKALNRTLKQQYLDTLMHEQEVGNGIPRTF